MASRKRILIIALAAPLLGFLPVVAHAATIDKFLTVQVYRLCDDGGLNCAATGPAGNDYFAAESNLIWSQAGISVLFNPVTNINSTAFSFLDDNVAGDGFFDLASAYGTFGPSNTTVDMFLVHTVAGAYGEGWLGEGGLVMAMDTVMSFNGGLGRIDTVAHELGHNFGLVPESLGGDAGHSANSNELMSSGGLRSVPVTFADIVPNGFGYDLLPPDQITLARQSSLLRDFVATPEPATFVLFASGLFAVGLIRRRPRIRTDCGPREAPYPAP